MQVLCARHLHKVLPTEKSGTAQRRLGMGHSSMVAATQMYPQTRSLTIAFHLQDCRRKGYRGGEGMLSSSPELAYSPAFTVSPLTQ